MILPCSGAKIWEPSVSVSGDMEGWRHISGDMFMEQSGHDFVETKIGQYTNALKWITCFLLDPV